MARNRCATTRSRCPSRNARWRAPSERRQDEPRMSDDALIGAPIDRVDGVAKVTGAARYAAEFAPDDLAYAVMVQATVPRGRIVRIDTGDAEREIGRASCRERV